MIQHPAFLVRPWSIHETELDLDRLAQTESIFAVANGHLGLRGNLDEGEPYGIPGSYLNGLYETHPLPYAEAGYGFPEAGETIINATNGKIIRLMVGDEPLDIRYGKLLSHTRTLDLRAGVLRRDLVWTSPSHVTVRVSSTRLVSFAQRAVAAILYEVEPVNGTVPVAVQSELIANESLPDPGGDPRVAAALSAPLQADFAQTRDAVAILGHTTATSELRMAAAMDHLVQGPPDLETAIDAQDDIARFTISTELSPGTPLRMIKLLAYGWSRRRSSTAVHDQVIAALAEARHTGWERLLELQRQYLDDFWDRADVEIDGDAELQQAVRFALFQTLQASARAERRAIPAKGLTGTGYEGHAFWDNETFVLPMLLYTDPNAAADALRWRHSTLPQAENRARQLGLAGASFPWRTISGKECSAYWPAGTAAVHLNADIAVAVVRHVAATGDHVFERKVGLELLVKTARLWRNLGHYDGAGRFRIDGVTGPDEYSAIMNNNVYTNLMAQKNLRAAANLAERLPDAARALDVDPDEIASWRDAAREIMIPYDPALGVHPQAEGFLQQERWDFDGTPADHYPLMLHYPYFSLYRKQVIKQADLVLAMQHCPDAFTAEQKLRNFAYYEQLTVRDSSLSACTQAVIAAEVGHLELAHDYLAEAAMIDLDNLNHNTRDGLHIASLAGTWIAIVAGFGGMRDPGEAPAASEESGRAISRQEESNGVLSFAPRLPPLLTRLRFRVVCRDGRLLVELDQQTATYSLRAEHPLTLLHHGQRHTLHPGRTLRCPIPELPAQETPSQPPGRTPLQRRVERVQEPDESRS